MPIGFCSLEPAREREREREENVPILTFYDSKTMISPGISRSTERRIWREGAQTELFPEVRGKKCKKRLLLKKIGGNQC